MGSAAVTGICSREEAGKLVVVLTSVDHPARRPPRRVSQSHAVGTQAAAKKVLELSTGLLLQLSDQDLDP